MATLLMGISFDREYSLVRDAAELEAQDEVLDLACGPGIYARRFARAVPHGRVVGLDRSIPMLRYAVGRARREGLQNLLFVHGDAMDLPFEEARFDAVNCCGALHLFPDARQVLRGVARVLRPNGRFTVAAYRRRDTGLSERASKARRRVMGLDSFTSAELASWFEGEGLSEPQTLHAGATWLVMSATKPGRNK